MDIRSLRFTVTLAEELHFGRAAERHFIAAQPFGRRIQDLERELGRKLFDRTSRRVRLTPAGQLFVHRARKLLIALDELTEMIRHDDPRTPDALVIGVFGVGLGNVQPLVVDAFTQQHPGLPVAFQELDFFDHYAALRDGTVDVAFVQFAGPIDGLVFEPVNPVSRVVIAPKRSQLSDADLLTRAELVSAPMLPLHLGKRMLDEWQIPEPKGDPTSGVRTPGAVPAAVALTGAVSPHIAPAAVYYPHPDVRFIPLAGPPARLAVATREADDRPAIRHFREAARTVARAGATWRTDHNQTD